MKQGTTDFRQIDAGVLNRYSAYLEKLEYAQKTLHNELTTLKQCVRWLIDAGHLVGREPVKLRLRKADSRRAYCYRSLEVAAILRRCREVPQLGWIGDAVTALACTGMRIDELAQLKWSDVDLAGKRILLADESGRGGPRSEAKRTLKSGHGRSFPLHDDLAVVLNRVPKFDGYVFHGPEGGRL